MRTPTVTLKRPSDGRELRVDRWRYALNIAAYLAKGYRQITEARGEISNAREDFEMDQAKIERERQETREAPKNYEARKIEVGEVREADEPSADPDDDIPKANPDIAPEAAQEAQGEEPAADPPSEIKKPATRAARGRRKAAS